VNRPRVLLADDHVVLLEGLRALLAAEFDVVGAVEDGRALLAAAESSKPDLVVVDISMPLLNGIEAALQLQKSCPRTKIVFLTMHKDAGLLKQALRAGASAYVLKQSAVRELAVAIREALAGRCYISPAIVEVLGVPVPVFLAHRVVHSDDLTPRQREVLTLVAEGKCLKEIAAILGISVKAAEFHKYRVMKILGLRTTAELTRYAVKYGLVSLE
jgi:DNA-binding NarL/FixJ family response regulator